MFLSRNKRNNVYPCIPQSYYIKVGFKGSKLHRHVFVMKIKNKMANKVDLDETAHEEPSDQELHYLHRCLFWSTGLKEIAYSIHTLYRDTWPRDYKTFVMLNSAEHEICPADKYKITKHCNFLLAEHS